MRTIMECDTHDIRKWRPFVDKIKRNERLSAIARLLTDAPNRIHTLGQFCALFDAAKSTVSEDIDLVSEVLPPL